jgi:hypothetical protein
LDSFFSPEQVNLQIAQSDAQIVVYFDQTNGITANTYTALDRIFHEPFSFTATVTLDWFFFVFYIFDEQMTTESYRCGMDKNNFNIEWNQNQIVYNTYGHTRMKQLVDLEMIIGWYTSNQCLN